MIQIKPPISDNYPCLCGGNYILTEILWQGLHVCEKGICNKCGKVMIKSIPVNQSAIQPYLFYPDAGLIIDKNENTVKDDWFTLKLKSNGCGNTEKI
jgi:hypothetical protein